MQTAISVFCALLLAGSSAGQTGRQNVQGPGPTLRLQISQVAAKYKIPGIAVAVIEHGQLREMEVIGVRDLKSGDPVTENTVFEAGSLGEPLYAYSVLLLAANGKFDAGSPIPKYFPLPYVRNLDATSSSNSTESLYDPRFNQITAIRVMNHTSGMPDWARNQHLHLMFPPGQKWSYSNEGYLYLQRAVEGVTNESTDEFLTRSVLGPARMAQSSFVWRDEYSNQIATGYDRPGAAVEAQRYKHPAAGTTLYTTIGDYARFVMLVLASAPAQRAHESAVSLMLNPTIPVDSSFSWGLGVGVEKSGDDLFFFNRGDDPGFQSFFIASRKTGDGVVMLTNSENGLDATQEIVAMTVGGNHPIFKSAFLHPR